jgi:dolichyl-diphosphooligosaccharide--protein glycosyltransferase/undecaprenyl-diphosphooligosaccharide--protein glycosyltransferase
MSKDYGFGDTNDFLLSLQTDTKLPKPTADVYYYLPMRMLEIFPTVEKFSALDLMNGDTKNPSLFFVSRNFSQKENIVNLGDGVSIDLKDKVVVKGNEKVAIKNFAQVAYTKDMQLKKQIDTLNPQGKLSVIYMSSFNTFLILDEKAYNSSYIQMLVLEEYDRRVWEEAILTPQAKVFKLKI